MHLDDQKSVQSSSRRCSTRAKPTGNDIASCVTAIAQPCIIDAWSPMKKLGSGKVSNLGSSMRQMRVDDSPDFRITKGNGVTTDSHRQTAMLNRKTSSSERIPLAMIPSGKNAALRTDSCQAFDKSLISGGNSERTSP